MTTQGKNATILTQFGAEGNSTFPTEPINAYSLAYSPSASCLFSATGQGIIRTNVDGSDARVILDDEDGGSGSIMSVTVAEREQKIYYGTLFEGLIKKANFDGSNVQLVRNVSQGLNYNIIPSYVPANFYPAGIVVDEDRGWLYWSASQGDDDGSIRRVPLSSPGGEEQVLAIGINYPTQLRIIGVSLYWAERGRWNTSPTAIKYLDRDISLLPSSTLPATPVPTGTLFGSSQSPLFFETDYTGDKQTLSIQSFVVHRGGGEQKVWFVVQSSGRTVFGKLVEVIWRGSGDGRGPVFRVLNAEAGDVGVPIGMEALL
jgi:hypothetical protein